MPAPVCSRKFFMSSVDIDIKYNSLIYSLFVSLSTDSSLLSTDSSLLATDSVSLAGDCSRISVVTSVFSSIEPSAN